MGQGFSQPDPATIDDDAEIIDDAPDAGFVPEEGSMLDLISDEVSCTNCARYEVCAIISGFRPMLNDWKAGDPGDEAPIDPVMLALICEAFVLEPSED